MVQVIARVHPFAPAQREAKEFPDGTTVQDIVSALVPVEVGRVIVMRDGEEVPRDRWGDSVSGGLVNVAVVPSGSEEGFRDAAGKTAGWSVALGVALFAASIITPIGWLAWAGVGLAVVGTIVAGGLATAANMLAAVSESTEATLAIAGGRNTVAPWGKVPVIIGKHRLTPHYAAGYYTYVSGDDGEDQYLKQIFCLGRNTLKVTDIKIGENLLATNTADTRNGSIAADGVYSDVTLQIYQDGTAPSEYPALVTQDEIGAALVYNTAVWRTSAKKTTELTVAINVAGLYKTENNARVNHTVTVEARYRAVGSGTAWASCPLIGELDVTKARAKLLRYELTAEVDEGQYEVGVMRTSADDPDGFNGASATTWAALRSLRNVPVVSEAMRAKVVLLAVTIKATDQLNGVIDNLNCICESVEHRYSGGNWDSSAVSRNPASHIIEGLVHGRFLNTAVPSAAIDWAAFQTWYTLCATNNWYCDKVISSSETLQSLCNKIAHAGRAYITLRDGLYTVVCDSARTTVVQHFSPRNVKSFSWTKSFADLPHGYRLGFLSADDDYQTSERLCLYDEYTEETATKLERVDLWGITDAEQVWKHGRYLLACRRLRPEAYTFETDVESIVCEPGDLILVAHDSIAVGIISGRVKALVLDESDDVVGVEIDEAIVAEVGVDYGVQIRAVDGFYYRTCTVDGNELTFSSVVPAGSLAVGDLYTLGEAGTETLRCVVSSIETGQEFGAKITCLDEAPDIHTADSGDIPAYSPLIGRKGQITTLDSNVEAELALTAAATAQATATAATTSLAPAAIAQYNPAYTPELPDDPAGVAWFFDSAAKVLSFAGCTLTDADGWLRVTTTNTDPYFTKGPLSFSGSTYRNLIIKIKLVSGSSPIVGQYIQIFYVTGSHSYSDSYTKRISLAELLVTGKEYTFSEDMGTLYAGGTDWTSSTINAVRVDTYNVSGNVYDIKVMFGTGAYLSPTLDTSGNGNHLTNTAAVPVDYNGRKWWYGNGATTGLYNSSVAIPDIVHFHCRAIPTASSSAKIFIVWGATAAHLGAFRNASNTELIVRYPRASDNATLAISSFFTEGAETVLDIEWNFTAQTISVKRDSVVVQEYSGLTTMVKPSGTALYLMRSFSGSYFLGYYTEAYITNKSLTAAQIRDLYYNGLPAELYNPAYIAAQSLALSGPTLFAYASGATVPVPTNVTLTATPQAFTATAYQWQYYAAGWNNLSDESGKVSGAATANLTIYYNATVWGTAKTLRLRCVANSSITKEISLAKIADGQGISIKGTVAEPADLADIVAPSVGDIYSVGSAGTYGGVTYDAGDGARWDGSAWVNIGAIQGPAGLNAPRYLGVGLLAADDNATFRLDTVDVDGDITTGTNVTATTSDLMVNHHSTGAAIALCRWSGTEWVATTEAKDLDLAATDIRNLATGGILIPGITVLKAAIVNNLQTETVKFEQSVSADKRATAGLLTAGDSRIAMGYDPGVPRWTAGNVVALGYLIREAGNYYICSTAGTTGSTAPTWPSSGTVSDNTAVWTYASAAEYEFAVSKYLGTVGGNEVWQKQFLTKALRSGLIGLLLIGGLESCAPIYSDPGRVWYRQEHTFGSYSVRASAYGDGKWVAVGQNGLIAYSTDKRTWTAVSSPFGTSAIRAIAYGGGKWVAVAEGGKIAYSTNATTWTLVTISPFGTTEVLSVLYGGGKWVAGDSLGRIAYSTDAASWTLGENPLSRVYGLAFNGEIYVAVGTFSRAIVYSHDAITWTMAASVPITTPTVYSVAYGNGVFVAGVASGKMFYSYDGDSWSLVSPDPFPSTTNVYAVACGDGKWVAVGQDGAIAQSFSAETWEQKAVSPYGTDGYYRGIAYSDSEHGWVATGYLYSDNSGIIITSDYLESGMGFTSRTVDSSGAARYELQDGERFYPNPWSVPVSFPSTATQAQVYAKITKIIGATVGDGTSAMGRLGQGPINYVSRQSATTIALIRDGVSTPLVLTSGSATVIGYDLQIIIPIYEDIT